MNCKEMTDLILPFIQGKLDADQTMLFLKHIENCPACREELEIYYMVYAEIDGLDNNANPSYDLEGELEKRIQQAYNIVLQNYRYRVFKYAVTTLAIIGMILTFFVQMRLWV